MGGVSGDSQVHSNPIHVGSYGPAGHSAAPGELNAPVSTDSCKGVHDNRLAPELLLRLMVVEVQGAFGS